MVSVFIGALVPLNPNTMADIKKVSYALGINVAGSLQQQGMNDIDAELFAEGLKDAFTGQLKVSPQEVGATLQEYFEGLQKEKFGANIEEGKKFLEENAKRDEVVVLESGLQYEVLTEGSGEKPKATDQVTTHYHGTLINGTVFDSSVERGQPATFPVNGVIQGWVEALQLMPVGSKWKLYVPSDLAYGERGAGQQIGPHTTLIFEVELLEIK